MRPKLDGSILQLNAGQLQPIADAAGATLMKWVTDGWLPAFAVPEY